MKAAKGEVEEESAPPPELSLSKSRLRKLKRKITMQLPKVFNLPKDSAVLCLPFKSSQKYLAFPDSV